MADLYNVNLGADSDDDDAPFGAGAGSAGSGAGSSGMGLKRIGAGASQRAPQQRPATGLMRRSGHDSSKHDHAKHAKHSAAGVTAPAPSDSGGGGGSGGNRRDSGEIMFFDEGIQQVIRSQVVGPI